MMCGRFGAASPLAKLALVALVSGCASGGDGTPGDDASDGPDAATGSSGGSGGHVSSGSGGGSSGAGSGGSSGGFGGGSSGSSGGSSGGFGGSGSSSGSGSGSSSSATSSSSGGSSTSSSGSGFDAAVGGDSGPDAPGSDSSSEAGSDAGAAEAGPPATGLVVMYQVGVSAATSAYVGCELSIANMGTDPVAVSSLQVRYFYTDEVHVTPQMTINWSHVSTSGADADLAVAPAFGAQVPPATGADSYAEFGFSSSHSMLAHGEAAVFQWQMQGPDPAKDVYTQTGDYSFDPSKSILTSWDHVVLLQNGALAWGTLP
jgi:hypothetical protein